MTFKNVTCDEKTLATLAIIEQAQQLVDATKKPHGIYLEKGSLVVRHIKQTGFKDETLVECITFVEQGIRRPKPVTGGA